MEDLVGQWPRRILLTAACHAEPILHGDWLALGPHPLPRCGLAGSKLLMVRKLCRLHLPAP